MKIMMNNDIKSPVKLHKAQTANLNNYETRKDFVKRSIKREKTQNKNINLMHNCNLIERKDKNPSLKFNSNIHWYCNCKDHRPKEPQIKKLNIIRKGGKTAPRLQEKEPLNAELKSEITPKISQFFDYGNKFLYE